MRGGLKAAQLKVIEQKLLDLICPVQLKAKLDLPGWPRPGWSRAPA